MGTYQIISIVLAVALLFLGAWFLVFRARAIKMTIQNSSRYPIAANNTYQPTKKQDLDLLEVIIDNLWHGLMIINSQREITKINEGLANLFYLECSQAIGKKTITVFNNNRLEQLISKTLTQGGSYKEQIVFYGDEELYLDMEAIPFNQDTVDNENNSNSPDKAKASYVIILAANNTQEMEFSKLRSQFVANVSHEMRTPLTSIGGYLETLAEDDLQDNERVKSYISKSLEETERLKLLIEDVLNLSRIEYKRNVLLKEEVDIANIIKETIESLSYLARQNSIDIHFDLKVEGIKFYTDEHLFRQMVKNLIENSIFHAGKNSRLDIVLDQGEKGIKLEFTDNGAGISKSDLPFIFQRFYRGKSQAVSRKISSGLGLSIVKHIVELHNGKIKVDSTPGIRTSFRILLPAR